MEESVYLNESDVAVNLLYAHDEKTKYLDYVWDMGTVRVELVMRKVDPSLGDLFTSKIGLGMATTATVAAIAIAFALYLTATSGKPIEALFQGISLVGHIGLKRYLVH